jgi:hypothetical protein
MMIMVIMIMLIKIRRVITVILYCIPRSNSNRGSLRGTGRAKYAIKHKAPHNGKPSALTNLGITVKQLDFRILRLFLLGAI